MGDVDAGNVKAKASIEYDPSGLKQFKEDLASLPEMVGGLGQSAGQAGEELSGLDEKMAANAESAKSFTSAIGELPKMVETGTSAVSEMSGVLSEQRSVVEEAGSAYENLQKRVSDVAPSMQVASEHTQKFAESLQTVSESFKPSMLSDFTENMAVFQDALVNPQPFSVIGQHLRETGQTWQDFTSSLTADNEAMAYEMAGSAGVTQEHLNMLGAQLQTVGTNFHETAGGAAEFTRQFNGVADSATSASKAINEFGGVGEALYGPLPKMAKPIGFGEAFAGATEGLMGVLNDIAMPLMAVQMIGMAIQATGQAIYDSAAIAEGPAAHSYGSFTGTVDALGQSVQRLGGQFSESFGQGIMPSLNQLNYQTSQFQGAGGMGGGIGGALSFLWNLWQIGSGFNPIGGAQGMANQWAQMMGMPQPFQGPPPEEKAKISYQQQFANLPRTINDLTYQTQGQADQFLAMANSPQYLQTQEYAQRAQQIYQRAQQDYDIRHPINQAKMLDDFQYAQYAATQGPIIANAQRNAPYAPLDITGYWGGVGQSLGLGGVPSVIGQTMGAIGDFFKSPVGSLLQTPFNPIAGIGGIGGMAGLVGDIFGGGGGPRASVWDSSGLGGFFGGIGNWVQGLFGGGGAPAPISPSSGGCFIAGTHVLMADGKERAIETLHVGERVLAHDGEKQVHAIITDCIVFPSKQTYKLAFSDGTILFTTDSHPIATTHGWKSISPASTAKENPDLPVTPVEVGDSIYTADGATCRLVSMQKHEIVTVYNVTVDTAHTYYANGILVHNAKLSTMSSGGVGTEQVSLSHTFTAQVTWEAQNLEKQFTAAASWAGQGLSKTFIGQALWQGMNLAKQFVGQALWQGQNLANTFMGVASWVAQGGLQHTFEGVASWVAQGGLEHTFEGVVSWIAQGGLEHTFEGIANWVGKGLENLFTGKANWEGKDLEHLFTATAQWTAQNLSPNFLVNPSFTMLAEGTSNWGGGPAIVGEAGPEVVESNGQYTMFDRGAALVDLPAGANVYPMRDLTTYPSSQQFADGTGSGFIPIGGNGGNMPQTLNLTLQIGPETIISAIGMPLAQDMRLVSGYRGY